MIDLRGKKVRVTSDEESRRVQGVAVSLGFKWASGDLLVLQSSFLFFGSNYIITHTTSADAENYFKRHKNTEISPEDILSKNMKDNLEVKKDRVLKTAKEQPAAREALESLFPEAFEEDKYFDLKKAEVTEGITPHFCSERLPVQLELRSGGDLAYKSFYLDPGVDWEITKDKHGNKCLLPTKK